ncbi:oligosaccharide flippase family protein [Magnetococcales bacterium HHB-1]
MQPTFFSKIKNLPGIRQIVNSDFIKKVIETLATRFFVLGVGAITSILVTRILGPEGRGLFAIAMNLGGMGVQLGNLGLHSSNTYHVAKHPEDAPHLFGNTLFICFVLGSFVTAIVGLFFYLQPAMAPLQGSLLFWSLFWIPFGLFQILSLNLLLGLHRVRTFNSLEIFYTLSIFFMALPLLYLGVVRAQQFFLLNLAALMMVGLLAYRALLRQIGTFMWRPDIALLKKNLAYGLKAYFGSMGMFLLFKVDIFMINALFDKKEVGYYAVAVSLGELLATFSVVFSTILFPKLAAAETVPERLQMLKRMFIPYNLAMLAICGVAAFFVQPLITLVYGELFLPSIPVFYFVLISVMLRAFNAPFSVLLGATAIPLSGPFFAFFLVTVNIILNSILLPVYGIVAAAWASALCLFGQTGYLLFYLLRLVRNPDLKIRW